MNISQRKKIYFEVVSVVAVCLFLIAAAEIFLRIYVYATKGSLALLPDRDLGWIAKPGFKFSGTIKSYKVQKTYKADITTNEYGFRKWGDLKSGKKRLFILGDSFTHSMYASDEKTWYSIFAEKTGTEVFAYGCSGYGTMQEYLIIKRYYELIKPDIIIIAFTDNDFQNNIDTGDHDPIENAYGRPYLSMNNHQLSITNDMDYRSDDKLQFVINNNALISFLCSHSHLAYFIFTRWKEVSKRFEASIPEAKQNENYRKSIDVTRKILSSLKNQYGRKSGILIFPLSCGKKGLEDLLAICKALDIRTTPCFDSLVEKADGDSKLMRAADGSHLNEDGEAIIGNALAEWFNSVYIKD